MGKLGLEFALREAATRYPKGCFRAGLSLNMTVSGWLCDFGHVLSAPTPQYPYLLTGVNTYLQA